MYTYIQPYTHTSVNPYIHTCIQTYFKSTPAWASRDHCLPGIGLLGAWPAGHPCGAQRLCWVTQRGASAILLGLLPELKPMAWARMVTAAMAGATWAERPNGGGRQGSAPVGEPFAGTRGFSATAHPRRLSGGDRLPSHRS